MLATNLRGYKGFDVVDGRQITVMPIYFEEYAVTRRKLTEAVASPDETSNSLTQRLNRVRTAAEYRQARQFYNNNRQLPIKLWE